jgi:hypothetical protein
MATFTPSPSLRAGFGSTSLTADVNGNKVLEIRYKAWGEVRATPAYKMPLYTYSGQASDSYRRCGLILYRSAFLLTK